MVVASAALLALLAGVVQVEGSTSCPRPDEVAVQIDGLLGAPLGHAPPDLARLSRDGAGIAIVLETAEGVVLGTRHLPGGFSCSDLAAAAAVALATWESDVHPEYAASALAPSVVASGSVEAPFASATAARAAFSAGLGMSAGSAVDTGVAAGVEFMAASWLRPGQWLTSLRMEVVAQSERRLPVGEGAAFWRRWSFGAGVERSFTGPPPGTSGATPGAWLRWFALARVGWLNIRGDGFAVDRDAGVLDPGVTVGLRALASPRRRWSPWLELAASAWPIRHDARVDPGQVTQVAPTVVRHLPASEVFLRAGLSWGDD